MWRGRGGLAGPQVVRFMATLPKEGTSDEEEAAWASLNNDLEEQYDKACQKVQAVRIIAKNYLREELIIFSKRQALKPTKKGTET